MKTGYLLIGALMMLCSCNNNSKQEEETATDSATLKAKREQQLKALVNKYPDSLLLEEKLVQFYRDNENYPAAIKETDAILKKDTMNDRWWDIKANLYSETDDTLNAVRSWEKASNINPQPTYLLPLGYLYADMKNPKALFIARLLMNSDSTKLSKESLLISGIYYGKTDKQKAISFFDKALAASYTFMPAYREKASALYDLGKYSDAIIVLERALTVQSTYDEAFYWLGRCYEKLGDKQSAMDNYEHAIEISKQTINGDYVEAREALENLRGK